MSNDKMREEFERTSACDTRRQPPKGNNYIDPTTQMDWLAFQKGWKQSRESLVIDPPFDQAYDVDAQWANDGARRVISAAGLQVKW